MNEMTRTLLSAGLAALLATGSGCGEGGETISTEPDGGVDVDGGDDYQPTLKLELKGNLPLFSAADVAAVPGKDIVYVSNWRTPTFSVIDVSEPSEPTLVTTLEAPESTDVQVKGDRLYVNGDPLLEESTVHGIRIYDIADPAAPKLVRLVGSDSGNIGVSACHNLWLQADRDLVYCASTKTFELVILSEGEGGVGAPADPKVIATLGAPGFGSGIHDMFARGNRLYVAWLEGGFQIYDITNAAVPVLLGGAETDEKFTHTVWPSEDGNYVFATDEKINGHLTIWDVADPTSISKVADYQPNKDAIVHNAEIVGDIAYISHYTEGVKILDVSDPTQPHEIDGYDMFEGPDFDEDEDPDFPGLSRFKGAWGVDADFPRVYVSTIESGLWVFELKEVANE